MFRLLVASCLVASIVARLSDCYYSDDDLSLSWNMTNNNDLVIDLARYNFDITNKYTGLAFGESKKDLELMLVVNDQQGTRFATGHYFTEEQYTTSYGLITMDNTPYVTPQLVSKEGSLHVAFSRPLESTGPHRKNLGGCTVWNIIREGAMKEDGRIGKHSSEPVSLTVCPESCRQ